jgi:NAD(P)-dependent dehydrogenase (short-subunit alcohol dehydrogenase family)
MNHFVQPSVLVSGAGKRLGREIALALAAAGWRVAIHYHHSAAQARVTADECSRLTPGAEVFQADLSDEASAQALIPAVIASFNRLDAVVNSASVFEFDDAKSFSYQSLARHMAVNTGAAIHLAHGLWAHFQDRDEQGVVVNLLDQKLWNQNPDFFSYTLSKAALEAATTMLAMGMAPSLRVVGVAPGLTLTSTYLSDEEFQSLHQLSPIGRSSAPSDVASAVLFACTNRAMTGTTLVVDGGQHLLKFDRDFSMMKGS